MGVAVVAAGAIAVAAVAGRRDAAPSSLASLGAATASPAANLPTQSASTTVDGVALRLNSPILPGGTLASTVPGLSYQVTSSVSYAPPYAAVELGAIPYGTHNPALSAQAAASGSAPAFRKEIADARAREGQVFARAAPAMLFGRPVEGQVTQTTEPVAGVPTTRLHAEWVTEAGSRVWILRITLDDLGDSARDALVSRLSSITLTSARPNMPTTITATAPAGPPPFRGSDSTFSLDLPPWWAGHDCDGGRNGAHDVLASWNGLEACGPNVDQLSVIYTAGSVPRWGGQLEWECVELSKRYLWQRYGISDQPADGFDTVDAEARAAPSFVVYHPDGVHVPQAGDVVSFGTVSPGHTAVVMSASIDGNGNGTYTTLNENVGRQGVIAFDISHWVPTTTSGGRGTGIPPVNDWLHDPRNTPGSLGPGGLGKPGSGLSTTTPASSPPPAEGAFLRTPDTNEYRVAGGAPIRVFSCTSLPAACATPREVAGLQGLRPFPADGTELLAAGQLYRVAGGAALAIGPCPATAGCSAAIGVDPQAITRLDHLRSAPADGTVLVGMPSGQAWLIQGGHRSPTPPTQSAVVVPDATLTSIPMATATSTPRPNSSPTPRGSPTASAHESTPSPTATT
jgi:hypothetical protein